MDRVEPSRTTRNQPALRGTLYVIICASICPLTSSQATAQNVAVGSPSTGDVFSSQPSGGFALNGGFGGWQFGLLGGQSSSRNISSQSPTITISDGGAGVLMDVIQRPFVIGYVPVVGGFHATYPGMYTSPAQIPTLTYPLHEKIRQLGAPGGPPTKTNDKLTKSSDVGDRKSIADTAASTATQPDIGVRAIQQRLAALEEASRATVAEFVAKARQAESDGDLSQAIRWIDKARRSSQGTRRKQYESQLRELRTRADHTKAAE